MMGTALAPLPTLRSYFGLGSASPSAGFSNFPARASFTALPSARAAFSASS